MSACWGSRVGGQGMAGLARTAWVLGALLIPGLAAGEKVDRVSVSPKGVVVQRSVESDSADAESDDPRDYGHGGWIEVDDHGDALVRVFGDIRVPRGKRVNDDVVAVFGSVDVEGEVEGDVVAVLGSVHVADGAVVEGEVVSVGGVVDQEDGALIHGQTVSVGFLPVSWGIPALPFTLSAVGAGWIATVLAGWILALAFPGRLVRIAVTGSRRTGASFLLGLLSVPGFVALMMLMFVTVVGIPLAFLLPFAYILLAYAGQLAATYVLGCKLTGRSLGSQGLVWPIVAGSLLVAAFFVAGAVLFVVPGMTRPVALFSALLGALLACGLTAIGTGAALLSKLGTEPKDVVWASEGPRAASVATPAVAARPPGI
jgi:hypothetical protein